MATNDEELYGEAVMTIRSRWDLETLMWEIDIRTIPYMNAIMRRGMTVNPDRLIQTGKVWETRIEEMAQELNKFTGMPDGTNYNSSKVVQELVFGKMGMRIIKSSEKTGAPSANKNVLEELRDGYDGQSEEWQILNSIQEIRTMTSFKSSWVDKLLTLRDSENVVRSNIRNVSIPSGRWAMAEPLNFMAVPIQGNYATELRQCFTPRKGWVWVKGDYSGIEMRDAAADSGDERMIGVFVKDLDIHTETAGLMFKIPVEQVDKVKHRYPAKRVGFQNMFGGTDHGLLPHLPAETRTLAYAGWMIKRYFEVHPRIKELADEVHAYARRYGQIRDSWGRMRYLPESMSTVRGIRMAGDRYAFSHRIQGSAQGIIKIPMGYLMQWLNDYYPKLRWGPLPQIHDELNFEVHPDDVDMFVMIVGNLMVNATSLGEVPIKAEFEVGETWGDTHHHSTATGTFRTEFCDVNWRFLGR